jgi:hypothetical protein
MDNMLDSKVELVVFLREIIKFSESRSVKQDYSQITVDKLFVWICGIREIAEEQIGTVHDRLK